MRRFGRILLAIVRWIGRVFGTIIDATLFEACRQLWQQFIQLLRRNALYIVGSLIILALLYFKQDKIATQLIQLAVLWYVLRLLFRWARR